jgi:hypothetical protein
MADLFDFDYIVSIVITLLWTGTLLAMAGLALFRFRATISGLLLGASFAIWALKLLLLVFVGPIVARTMDDPMPFWTIQSLVSTAVSLLLTVGVGAGIAFIPASLRKLSRG